MKIFKLLFILLIPVTVLSQKKEVYYSYDWKECPPENARYYSVIEKTDSGWYRKDYYVASKTLQMEALFEDEDCKVTNGSCKYYFANGYPSLIGKEIHGKQEGICLSFYDNGMLSDSALFHDGKIVDKRFKWHPNGVMADSINRINDSTEVDVQWFDDGSLAAAGHLRNGKQAGKWQYFYRNSKLSSLEEYAAGKLKSATYYDESGQIQTDTSAVNREADFKGGISAWKKYLEKNIYWPPNLNFTTPGSITVMIDFTIDENGKVTDPKVSLPFYPDFDKIALTIIKKSPDWMPRIAHNRKVKAYRRQPITFAQQE